MRERILRSPQGGPSISKAVKSQPIKPAKKIFADKSQYCSQKSESGKDSSSLLHAEECKRIVAQDCKTTIAHGRPCDSTSESDSITEDGNPAPRVAPVNLLRRSRYESSIRRKVVPNKNGEETFKRKKIIKALGMELSEKEDRVRTSSLYLRGGDPEDGIQNSNLDTPCDYTTSSDSASSLGKLSEQKTGWTWTCSTCTETDSRQRDFSPPERPAKKNCGARASREVPSVWNSMERLTSKRFYHSDGRIGEREETINVYETSSQMLDEDKDPEDSRRYMAQERIHLHNRYKDKKHSADADKMRVQEPGRHSHTLSRLEISTKIIRPEQFHAEIAWIASSGSTRCPQRVSDANDHNDEVIKVKIEKGFNGAKTKEQVSHNKLRDVVEAVWKTNLGTKAGIENEDMDIKRVENYWHNEEDLNVPLLRAEILSEKIHEKSSAHKGPEEDADDKVSAYKKAWRAIGTEQSGQDNFWEREFSDPVFWCIQRDHENLEALVAKEEGHQKDQCDEDVMQAALERKVNGAEHQSSLHETSNEVEIEATGGTHEILNERAVFHFKFKEELEQGVSDGFKLQQSSNFHKPRLDSEEAEVNDDTRRSLSAKGKRASPPREPKINSNPSHNNLGPGKAQLNLMAQSEIRIAAEAKASYYEACAKAAEKRLHSLLDERNWYYKKFVEEVEYKNDMKRLQQLLEVEKAIHAGQGQKQKLDVRLLVASSVADEPFGEENGNDGGKLSRDVHDIGSCQSDQEDLLQEDYCNRLAFSKWEQELEKAMSDGKGLVHDRRGKIEEELSDFHDDEERNEEISTPQSSIPRFGDGDLSQELITHSKTKPKNEKKRPLSPMIIPELRDGKPSELNEFVKVEKCFGRERTSRDFIKSSTLPPDFMLATEASIIRNEDTFQETISSDPALKSCEESTRVVYGKSLPLPTNWKMETKAELRRIIQEQEFTWKMAEISVIELARRLEVLENFKSNLQETLKRSRGTNNMDCLLSQREKKLEDFPGGFDILYSCPFFEEHDVENENNAEIAKIKCLSPKVSQISKDYEIQILKAEISHLRNEISGRKQHIGPQTKALVTDRDCSCLSNEFEGVHLAPKTIVGKSKQELPNDSFQEKFSTSPNAAPKSWTNSPRNIDPHVYYKDFTPTRQVHGLTDSNHSQTPNEDKSAKNAIVEDGMISKLQWMAYPNHFSKEGGHFTIGDGKSNEGDFQDTRILVQTLSNMFLGQEVNFKNVGTSNETSLESMASCTYYSKVLKTLSQQLADICHDLFAISPSNQMCHEMELKDEKTDPTINAINTQYIGLEKELRNGKFEPNTILTNEDPLTAQHPSPFIATPTSTFLAEIENLRISLQASEKKIEEESRISSSLIEKLEFQAKHISEVMEEHAQELVKKDERIYFEEQLNMDLSCETAHIGTTLADFRSHNKGLVVDLDSQLQAARSEVKSLRGTMLALKIDLDKKETLASSLKGERNKFQPEIEDLKSQIGMFQSETNANFWEDPGEDTLKLVKTINETKTKFDDQQQCINKFVSINENLILVAQSTENEIRTLTEMVTSLQQSLTTKSDESQRLLQEKAKMSQDVIRAKEVQESCEHHYKFIESKLEEIEMDLKSREETMERLSIHLGKTIEGQHVILEEKEHLLLSLNNALDKEKILKDQVEDLKIVIWDLEEKLNFMDEKMIRMKMEMDRINTTTINALAIERQTKELKNRVHQLEEEMMEKEGQITILTSSFP